MRRSRTLTFILLSLFSANAHSKPSDDVQYFVINTKPLGAALRQISTQFNQPIVISLPPKDLSQPTNLKGYFTVSQALDKLLYDDKFQYELSDDGIAIGFAKLNTQTQEIEQITVTGYRSSFVRASLLKQKNNQILDGISASEMSVYPDLNIAESLQRISGVSITREAGEGRQVSLRGLPADFTQVTINGVPLLINNDSPMDSRVQKQRDRSLDFNVFASEVFQQVLVKKSYSAEQLPGGVAGTVALATAKPFDFDDMFLRFNVKTGANQYDNKLATKLNLMFANTWNNWGLLLMSNLESRSYQELGANTFRWRKMDFSDVNLSVLEPEQRQLLQNTDVSIPRGNRYSIWHGEQERQLNNLTLQYQSEKLQSVFTAVDGQLEQSRFENHLYARGLHALPAGADDFWVTDFALSQGDANDSEMVFGQFQNVMVATESREQTVNTDHNLLQWHTDYTLFSGLKVSSVLSSSKSRFDIPRGVKAYTQALSDFSFDYRPNRFYGDYQYSVDTPDIASWRMAELDSELYQADTRQDHAQVHVVYDVSASFSVSFGGAYNRLENTTRSQATDNYLKNNWNAYLQQTGFYPNQTNDLEPLNAVIPAQYVRRVNEHPNTEWLGLAAFDIADHYCDLDVVDSRLHEIQFCDGSVNEETLELSILKEEYRTYFVSANYGFQLADKDSEFEFGLREINRDLSINGRSETNLFSSHAQSQSQNYWLPSLSFVIEWSEQQKLKLSVSKNLTFPYFEDITAKADIDHELQIIYLANPNLEPYSSNNYDLSLEHYFNNGDYLSLAGYYKSLKKYITPTAFITSDLNPNLAGLLPTELPNVERYSIVAPQNNQDAHVYGIELSGLHSFDYLPSLLSRFGFNGHVTYNQGKLTQYSEDTGQFLFEKDFPQLSEWNASATLFYEHEELSARLSGHYRGDYLYSVNNLIDQDESGFLATVYWDFSLNYQLNQQLCFQLDLINISNESERQYSHSTRRGYNSTTSGRTFYVGVSWVLD